MTEDLTVGWKLELEDRDRLLARFPPAFPDVIADHVTLGRKPNVPGDVNSEVIGYASDAEGIEALVVAIDGRHNRPDGSIFHITWSLDKAAGKRAVQSNDLLQNNGFIELNKSIKISLRPAILR